MATVGLIFEPWLVLVYAAIIAVAYRRPILVLPVAGASLTTHVLKQLFAVPRPEGAQVFESSYSFPSGHATAIAALACLLIVLCRRWWMVIVAVALALLVGYSRIALGVHRPVDILAGYFVGAFFVLAVARAVQGSSGHGCFG